MGMLIPVAILGNVDTGSYFNEFNKNSSALDSTNYKRIYKIRHFYRTLISLKCATYS